MKVTFKTFNVGNGDCITLFLKNGNNEIHILVDCGNYTQEVDEYVIHEFHSIIDYLIVTHIDDDHIRGLISMLEKRHDLVIKHILYNCYQRMPNNPQQWDDKMKANVKRVMGNLPIVIDMLEYKVSSESAKTLAEAILSNEQWRNAWKREYITDKSKPIELENGLGHLLFLSPSKTSLDAVDLLYRKLFWEKLYKQKEEDYNDEETIYEALIRCYSENRLPKDDVKINSTDLSIQSLMRSAENPLRPASITNMSSIAFIWELEGHRILFLGDACPLQVCKSLSEKYAEMTKPILFDIIKVSHHGSAENTSNELVATADSEQYFFTGKTKTAPAMHTLARIITAPLSDSIKERYINYNRESKSIRLLKDRRDLQEQLHFSIQESKEYEFYL